MNIFMSAAFVLLLASAPAFADAIIRQRAESNGYRGMGAFESETTREISGLKSREEGTFKFTGAILGRLTSKKQGDVEILRVDLDKKWTLDEKKKTYTEDSITPKPGDKDDEEAKEEKKAEESKPTHRIKKTSFDVKTTSDKKTINGFEAQRYAVEFVMEVEEIATKDVTTYKMLADQWLTPWTKTLRAASDEDNRFTQAHLKKLGVELSAQDKAQMGLTALMMLTQAGGPELQKTLGDMKKKLAKMDGYTVRTVSRWYAAAPPSKKKKAKEAAVEDDEPVDVSNGVGGLLGGLAKKAAAKKARKMADEREAAQEGKPAFETTTEILSVSDASLPKDAFEIPEGFKKKS